MKMQTEEDDKIVEEFSKRIRTYDALSFLEDKNILSRMMQKVVKMDQKTIAELTSKQLRALPLRR